MGFAENLRVCSVLSLSVGLLGLFAIGVANRPVQAQILFCPVAVPGGATSLQSGVCTNGAIGALTTAALASQSLSEISQSTTQQSNAAALDAISERRKQEAERCPAGYERANGSCRKIATAPAPPPRSHRPRHTATISGAAPAAPSAPPRVYKAEPLTKAVPVYVDERVHPAVWAYGFGGYERRTTDFAVAGPRNIGPGGVVGEGGGARIPTGVDIVSQTTMWGVVSGADLTFRNIGISGDVLISGILAGYMASDVTLNATGISSNPATVGNGLSRTNIRLNGPSAGAFATYFSGPFSADLTFKADFMNINENFFEILSFNGGVGAVPFGGTSSAHVDNLSTIGDLNYRFPISGAVWVEPTVGFDYTYSLYDSAARLLGLTDGYVLRLLGGARFGSDFFLDHIRVTPTVTGLVYDDVKVVGGAIVNGAFVGGPFLHSDEGKLRCEGIFTVNFDYGNGLSSFVLAMVYGGQDLIGAGGKAGVRYQW